jgi:LysM domain
MSRALIKLLGMATFGVAVITASAFAAIYVVKDGDTLSKIAAKSLHGKIYGKEGGIEKLVALNPKIKNPNLIFPGDEINLSNDDQKLADSSPQADMSATRSPAAAEASVIAPNSESPVAATLPEIKPVGTTTESEGYSLIDMQPRFFYSRVDGSEASNGSGAILLSKLNYGLNASWRQLWSDTFESFVNLGLTKFEFTSSSSRTLEGEKLTQSDLEVGAKLKLSSKTQVMFSLGAGEELFYQATTPTTVKIDSVMVPKLNAGITQVLYTKKPFTLGSEFKFTLLSSANTDNYKVKSGWGYLGRVFVKQESKKSNLALQTGLFYGQHLQNTSIVNLKRSDLGVDFGLSWSFGK